VSVFTDYVAIDRQYDASRVLVEAALNNAGLKRHVHYQFYYVNEAGTFLMCGWDGTTLPSAQEVIQLRTVGFTGPIQFSTYGGRTTHLHPDGRFENRLTVKEAKAVDAAALAAKATEEAA